MNKISKRSSATVDEYLRIAENWLIKQVDQQGQTRTATHICDALYKWSEGKRPATFRKMRIALNTHQFSKGFYKASKKIKEVKRVGHGKANTRKTRRCKSVTEKEHQKLLGYAKSRNDKVAEAALIIACKTGVRPVEMPTMKYVGLHKNNRYLIFDVKGAKVNETINRGMAIKRIAIEDADNELRSAIKIISKALLDKNGKIDKKKLEALKRRISRWSHNLFPKRKHPPTLYSYRHQLCTDLKKKGDRVKTAAVMGHHVQRSANIYGHKNSKNGGLKRLLPIASKNTTRKVQLEKKYEIEPNLELVANSKRLKRTYNHDYGM